MISRIYRALLTISLGSFFSLAIVFGVAVDNSWATTSFAQLMSVPQIHIAALDDRAKAVTKNLEGKAQDAIGNITGDPKDQISGKSKQVESKARNLLEDVKEKVQGFFK